MGVVYAPRTRLHRLAALKFLPEDPPAIHRHAVSSVRRGQLPPEPREHLRLDIGEQDGRRFWRWNIWKAPTAATPRPLPPEMETA
jgi:hypothetical protein